MIDYNCFYLHLIRHGQSEANTFPDTIGQGGDTPLTELGRHQAVLLRDRFKKSNQKFDKVFSSSYSRAYNTAKIVTESIDIPTYPDIREYDAGDWSGLDRKETYNQDVKLRMASMGSAFLPPGGESMHMVERRASAWLEDNILYNKEIQACAKLSQHAELDPLEIAVFSHGMTIRCLLHYIMGFDQNFTWKLTLENTSICKLYFNNSGWRVITINDSAHLL